MHIVLSVYQSSRYPATFNYQIAFDLDNDIDIYYYIHIFIVGSMVVYVINGTIIAGGHVQPERDTILGSRIPQDHLSVMIATTKPNHAAPLVLGDESENSFLEEGKFFALPIANLMRAMLLTNKSLSLTPYASHNRK